VDDFREIENLIYRYTVLVDGGDWDAFCELFAEAELVAPAMGALRGAAEVRAWLQANIRRYSDGTLRTSHATTNVLIEIDDHGNGAQATSYLTVFQNVPADVPGAPLQPISCGRYHDRFAKSAGRWRFVRREIVGVSVGDLSAHRISS
jgi:hypothetical protein